MQPFYQRPKPKFGEILNATKVTSRDLNKDLMMKSQQNSHVRNLSKNYNFKQPTTLTNKYLPKSQIQKY